MNWAAWIAETLLSMAAQIGESAWTGKTDNFGVDWQAA